MKWNWTSEILLVTDSIKWGIAVKSKPMHRQCVCITCSLQCTLRDSCVLKSCTFFFLPQYFSWWKCSYLNFLRWDWGCDLVAGNRALQGKDFGWHRKITSFLMWVLKCSRMPYQFYKLGLAHHFCASTLSQFVFWFSKKLQESPVHLLAFEKEWNICIINEELDLSW